MIFEANSSMGGNGAKEKTARRRPPAPAPKTRQPPDSLLTLSVAPASVLQEQILDKLCFAILTVDEGRRPLYLNAAAGRLLKEPQSSPIVFRGGRVVGRRSHEEEALRLALGGARSGDGGCAIIRGDPEEERVFALKATLLTSGETPEKCEFLLVFSNPQLQESVKTILASLFGLTRAEAQMALLLARGHSLEAAAAVCDITLATARTHLKRAFDKTGTHSQSQFVVLVHHLAPVF